MNPNSRNQLWSRWLVRVFPPRGAQLIPFETVKTNAARFMRKAFGSASQMRVTDVGGPSSEWRFDLRTDGQPAHDPQYVAYMEAAFLRFFANGFGDGTRIRVTARIEAGDVQDGTPPSQLIMLPTLVV